MSQIRRSLNDWLCYLEKLHPTTIELGLARVNKVKQSLNLDFSGTRVITVGGTNGKGTTCSFVEQACLNSGKSVAVYSSPHLIDYRERVRINGHMLSESEHCKAFEQVELARGDISLTYFEFGTLAALVLINQFNVDVALLEVGLGGRLDAVNAVEPDLSVITTIDIDHQDWLGDNRESIGKEKAGIFRQDKPAIIGDFEPPMSVVEHAKRLNVQAYFQGRDFYIREQGDELDFVCSERVLSSIPRPNIPMQNVATGLAILNWLKLELSDESLRHLISSVSTPGRMQLISHSPNVIIDVAHNPQAVTYLKTQIEQQSYVSLRLVCAMLKDKDIKQCMTVMSELSATWYLASIDHPRGASADDLVQYLDAGVKCFEYHEVRDAFDAALSASNEGDLVVVFGSFFTLSAILDSTHLETSLGLSVTK